LFEYFFGACRVNFISLLVDQEKCSTHLNFLLKKWMKNKNIKIIKVLSHPMIGVTYYVSIKVNEWIERKRNGDKLIFSGRMLVNNDGKQKFQSNHNYLCK